MDTNNKEKASADNIQWQRLMNSANIGWWKADFTTAAYTCSPFLVKLLDLKSEILTFHDFMYNHITEEFQTRIAHEFLSILQQETYEQIFPIHCIYGKVWIRSCLAYKETDPDGHSIAWGTLQLIDSFSGNHSQKEQQQKLNSLFYQQNAISRSLLFFTQTERIDKAIDSVLREILLTFQGERVYIFEFNYETNEQHCIYEVVKNNISTEKENLQCLKIEDFLWWSTQLINKHPIILSSLKEIPPEGWDVYPILAEQNIKSLMVAPLMANDKVWGYMGVDMVREHRKWTDNDYQWFSSLANIVSLCIELYKSREKTEEANRLKSAFLANMSHEIRTPLNAIVGFSALLTESEDANERMEYLQIVERNNDLLLQLISDILDLSKIESGIVEMTEEEVEVNSLCADIVNTLCVKTQPEVKLLFKPGAQELHIRSDKKRITQVITNLINNAIKFTYKGSITLGYEIKEKELKCYVWDTGSGIPEEQQKQIFNRFVKLNSFVPGTGLGLAICQSIVKQFNGRIGVKSEVGKGSYFWFTHPLTNCVKQ